MRIESLISDMEFNHNSRKHFVFFNFFNNFFFNSYIFTVIICKNRKNKSIIDKFC